MHIMAQNIPYKLRSWINPENLKWPFLCENPNAISILENNPDKISWYLFTENPHCLPLIEQNQDKLDELCWSDLFKNPNAIVFIERNIEKLEKMASFWDMLSQNPNAMHILKNHPDKISFRGLSCNNNPEAIRILEENYGKIHWPLLCRNPSAIALIERRLGEPYIPEINWLDFRSPRPHKNINWSMLSENPNAMHILKQNPDKIVLHGLCANTNPEAVEMCAEILAHSPSQIEWGSLSGNPSAIDLLEENQEKINYPNLSKNPAIFVYDYEEMKRNHMDFKQELMEKAWAPERIFRFMEKYNVEPDDL
jgi:hypothetical protein